MYTKAFINDKVKELDKALLKCSGSVVQKGFDDKLSRHASAESSLAKLKALLVSNQRTVCNIDFCDLWLIPYTSGGAFGGAFLTLRMHKQQGFLNDVIKFSCNIPFGKGFTRKLYTAYSHFLQSMCIQHYAASNAFELTHLFSDLLDSTGNDIAIAFQVSLKSNPVAALSDYSVTFNLSSDSLFELAGDPLFDTSNVNHSDAIVSLCDELSTLQSVPYLLTQRVGKLHSIVQGLGHKRADTLIKGLYHRRADYLTGIKCLVHGCARLSKDTFAVIEQEGTDKRYSVLPFYLSTGLYCAEYPSAEECVQMLLKGDDFNEG